MQTFSEYIKLREDCGCGGGMPIAAPMASGASCGTHSNIVPSWGFGYSMYKNPEEHKKHRKHKKKSNS